MILIKICGVTDPDMASFAASQGASFIGIIFEPSSHRFVKLEKARAIASAARQCRAIPVGVFTTQNVEEIQKIVQTIGLEVVQLHDKEAKSAHRQLPAYLKRFFVLHVEENGTIQQEDLEGIDPARDFLMYDGMTAGSGKNFNWENFEPNRTFRFFLAGGLNSDNVSQAIKMKHPTAVDVSSGVEDPMTKKKDKNRISLFIQAVREVS